jgi:hypothetical protein
MRRVAESTPAFGEEDPWLAEIATILLKDRRRARDV